MAGPVALACLASAACVARPGAAQLPAVGAPPSTGATIRPAVGVTGILATHPLGLATVGLDGDAGLYARLGLSAGIGATAADGGHTIGEFAATARFLLDPLRQTGHGLYATGGLAVRVQSGERPRPFVLAGIGIEGRPIGRVIPAIEAGLGGGARLGLVLRPTRPGRR